MFIADKVNEKRLQRLNDRQSAFNVKYKKTLELQQEKQQEQYKETSNNNIISSTNNNEFNAIMDVSSVQSYRCILEEVLSMCSFIMSSVFKDLLSP